MQPLNDATRIRRDILTRIIQLIDNDELIEKIDYLPIEMRPRKGAPSRCCTYKDRAVLKYRIMGALGFGIENETDETKPLSEYAREALTRDEVDKEILSVLDIACSGCIRTQYLVTDTCRGCLARPCRNTCPRDAITVENGRAKIDPDKCINCGKCMTACPYHAIVRTPIPCEETCPVGAIRRDESGTQYIDYDKCVSCGKCVKSCPFAAVVDRSQIVDIIRAMKSDRPVIAMVAPAIAGQFPGTLNQIAQALEIAGFARMEEVAYGAETTTEKETAEFAERMAQGDPVMTTSCCPAYVQAVKSHLPEMLPYVSHTLSPMKYTAESVRKETPNAVSVFIGPCFAKKKEAQDDPNTDFVLTFDELQALFDAKNIEPSALEGIELPTPPQPTARGFATSCGVTSAILKEQEAKNITFPTVASQTISGLDKKTLNKLRLYAKGKLPGNFLEVMCCEEGCVGGPGAIAKVPKAAARVRTLAEE